MLLLLLLLLLLELGDLWFDVDLVEQRVRGQQMQFIVGDFLRLKELLLRHNELPAQIVDLFLLLADQLVLGDHLGLGHLHLNLRLDLYLGPTNTGGRYLAYRYFNMYTCIFFIFFIFLFPYIYLELRHILPAPSANSSFFSY